MKRIGVVDTTFARVDMAEAALAELRKLPVKIERRTVPGIKDLAVECKRLLDGGCDACLALGWVGAADIDQQWPTDRQTTTPFSLPFRDTKIPGGTSIYIELRSTDGTTINVEASLSGTVRLPS